MEGSIEAAVPAIEIISPVSSPTWNDVLTADPDATAQQTPEYAAAVRRATRGRDASRLYLLADGRRLVLPLVHRTLLPGVSVEASFPTGYGHGGLLADGGVRPSDLRTVVEDLRGRRTLSTGLDGHHHTAERWSAGGVAALSRVVETRRRVDVIDLSGGFDQLWSRGFNRGVRSNVRKAERLGVRIERDTTGRLIPVFYQVYRGWVEERLADSAVPNSVGRRLAWQRDPLKKIETVAGLLGDKCRVWVAWHDDRPVAASITLVHGRHATGWRTCSVKSLAAPLAANTYLHVAEFKDAVTSGCESFDLGQSSDVPGLLDYKRSLGGAPRQVIDLRVEPRLVTRARSVKTRSQSSAERILAAHRRLRSPRGK